MTKDAKQQFYAIQYIDKKEIDIMPKVVNFEILNIQDETSKEYFRIYETAQGFDGDFNPSN